MGDQMYRVYLNGEEIGTALLKPSEPSMGVASGQILFQPGISPFHLFLDYCRTHGVQVNQTDAEFEFIDTQVIPGLKVVRSDGLEIQGFGSHIMGMKEEGYEIHIIGIAHPFYGEVFPRPWE